MTMYGRSDITYVEVSGVGHSHEKKKADKHMTVTCLECEPELKKMGWTSDFRSIELTPDEEREYEAAREDIARFESLTIAENAREAAAAVRNASTSASTGRRRGAAG